MEIASSLRGTADEALGILMAESTVHVPLTPVQHERWSAAAGAAGVPLHQFVELRVEAALHGADTSMIERTYHTVRAIAAHHGVRPNVSRPTSTDDLQQ